MGTLFLRNARLTLTTGSLPFSVPLTTTLVIEKLRISFNIVKDGDSGPNKAKISIYNLSESTYALLENTKALKIKVKLETGYAGDFETLYIGDVIKSVRKMVGPDRITTIELATGSNANKDVHFDKSYKAGTNKKTIIKDIVNKIKAEAGIAVKNLGEINNVIAQNGISISGMAKDLLDTLLGDQGLEYSNQDDILEIVRPNGDIGESVISLSSDSGLLEIPAKRDEGIQFKALIQTGIKPGRLVEIKSNDVNGQYRIRKCKYKGDTHDKDWFVESVAIPPSAGIN